MIVPVALTYKSILNLTQLPLSILLKYVANLLIEISSCRNRKQEALTMRIIDLDSRGLHAEELNLTLLRKKLCSKESLISEFLEYLFKHQGMRIFRIKFNIYIFTDSSSNLWTDGCVEIGSLYKSVTNLTSAK